MKPILYEATEQNFNDQGLGTLYDTLSCSVTEERNGIYELRMVYDINGVHYKEILNDRIILAKANDSDDPQPFRIYKITRPLDGKVTVYGEHISYTMSRIPVSPFTASNVVTALSELESHALISCPFTFWTDKTTQANFAVTEPSSMRSRLGGVQGSILDVYGGEWKFDRFYARLYNNRGADNGVVLRYGKNITDISQEESIANTNTGIVPFWKGEEDDGTEVLVTLPEDIIYINNHQNFPYERVVPVNFSDKLETKPTVTQLRNAAISYMESNNIGVPSVSISVSFIALWQTEEYKDIVGLESVRLCDTVTIEFEKLGISAQAKVVKTVYDSLNERYESIDIGDARANFGNTIKQSTTNALNSMKDNFATKSFLEKAIDHATDLITGGLGGYVVLKPNANGQPEEILILGDSPDYTVAQKVWRWNKNGLGYSSTGYNGTFQTAITSDGHIVADFMDTGILNAALITVVNLSASVINTGVFSVSKNNQEVFYANVDTGAVRIVADSFSLSNGDTIQSIAEDAAEDVVDGLSQSDVFNKLTNNGQTQGIYLSNGRIYINASYINTGRINITRDVGGETVTTFEANADTGYVAIRANYLAISDYTTGAITSVQTIANNAGTAAVNAQTQTDIFNKLTNNGQTQGIYLHDGKVYINASYIDTGRIGITRNVGGERVTTFEANADTGYVAIRANYLAISDYTTGEITSVQTIANNAGTAAVNAQTQTDIFNKLTNNGQTQGIYLSNGKLYINASYINTGRINITRTVGNDTITTFEANADTGYVAIRANYLAISDYTTGAITSVQTIANNAGAAAVNAQTQTDIFNKLTNNGQTQGIYLHDGKVYINGQYIRTGILEDVAGNVSWNLTSGAMSAKNLSITSGNFELASNGVMTLKHDVTDSPNYPAFRNIRFKDGHIEIYGTFRDGEGQKTTIEHFFGGVFKTAANSYKDGLRISVPSYFSVRSYDPDAIDPGDTLFEVISSPVNYVTTSEIEFDSTGRHTVYKSIDNTSRMQRLGVKNLLVQNIEGIGGTFSGDIYVKAGSAHSGRGSEAKLVIEHGLIKNVYFSSDPEF